MKSKNIWELVYRQRKTPQLYPYETVVTLLMPLSYQENNKKSVLEIGMGMGNNLWFAAREGFQVTGIDGSKTAIEFAKRRFYQEDLKGRILQRKFGSNLPFKNQEFDIILDMGSLTCAGKSIANQTIYEIERIIKPGGIFLFTPFSTNDSSFLKSKKGEDGQRNNIYGGTVRGVGPISFYSWSEIRKILHKKWKIIRKEKNETLYFASKPNKCLKRSYWVIVCKKV